MQALTTAVQKKRVPLGIVLVNYKNHDETVEYVNNELCKISTNNVLVIVNNADPGKHGLQLAEAIGAQHYHSSDLTPFPQNHHFVISEPENLGYARGNNLGFAFL